MKKILILIIALLLALPSSAQLKERLRLGVHTGIDIGAASPWPVSKAVSGDDKLAATPKLRPAIGAWVGYKFDDKWSVNFEATYKTVALDATVVTLSQGQRFTDSGNKVLFKGKATTEMSFTMLELPLYVRYAINPKNAVMLGGYCSYITDGEFTAIAIQGTVVNADTPDELPKPTYEGELPPQVFDSSLRKLDIGWMAGYERKVTKRINATARFSMGLRDIFKPGENYLDYSMIHMRGTLTVGYRIFQQ